MSLKLKAALYTLLLAITICIVIYGAKNHPHETGSAIMFLFFCFIASVYYVIFSNWK